MNRTDTICAISTPPGIGGIAVARVSGPDAIKITDSLWTGRTPLSEAKTHTAHFGRISDSEGKQLDEAVATVFRAPHSFTGDDIVEISVHGSRFVQRELISSLINAGCRLAEPGEFTRRAFTAGRMDLAEAEAVADIIASNSRAAHRIALSQMRGDYSRKLNSLRDKLIDLSALLELELDFSEEEVEFASRTQLREIAANINAEVSRLHKSFAAGTAIKEGIPVAIVGPTNAGKSSLLNAIVGDDRAIVSDIRGTTRDTIEETLEQGDYLFRFIDTAGLRDTSDTIERQGIERSRRAIAKARIVILVVDPAEPIDSDLITSLTELPHLIVAINKTDKTDPAEAHASLQQLLGHQANIIHISAKNATGIDALLQGLEQCARIDNGSADEGLLVTNARHAQALGLALRSSAAILDGLDSNLPGDLIAQDLRETIHHLSTITATITTTDILSTIFSRFCIGK